MNKDSQIEEKIYNLIGDDTVREPWEENAVRRRLSKELSTLLNTEIEKAIPKPTVSSWDEIDGNMENISALQGEFHARFGGEKFMPYIDPVRVFNWILDSLPKSEKDSK